MTADTMTSDSVQVEGAPDIPGLTFRLFRGESEFPGMVAVLEASKTADGQEDVDTVENMTRMYANLKNCDPYKDVVIVEMNGEAIGYKRVSWWSELDGTHIYNHFGFLVPQWRGRGIGAALLRHSEARLREIAEGHPKDAAKFFDTGSSDTQPGLTSLVEGAGYTPTRYFYDMVRPDLENIPDLPMPEGLEVRPVQTEQLRAIWEAEVEAFKDHWGEWDTEEADYGRWLDQPSDYFQPRLWMVAWEGDQVAGMVRNFIDENQNSKFGRKRGYTENISTRRAWRKRGLARALIARSFTLLREQGMTEAALGVDTENPSGALRLYEGMGFRTTKTHTAYRKPMA